MTRDELYQRELEPHTWQTHVEEEMARVAREGEPIPDIHHFAEEYAERAMRGLEATPNEYQRAEEQGEKHTSGVPSYLADAGDIAGG